MLCIGQFARRKGIGRAAGQHVTVTTWNGSMGSSGSNAVPVPATYGCVISTYLIGGVAEIPATTTPADGPAQHARINGVAPIATEHIHTIAGQEPAVARPLQSQASAAIYMKFQRLIVSRTQKVRTRRRSRIARERPARASSTTGRDRKGIAILCH